ncbi:hypothetical protein [Tenacibaculum sp. 190524A02b]|uniref:Uncharacterized protein n=1 Tax=Tenacibaculum vairaonense TaxID=3137860 RepID=A0ABM9PP24_9FLAO
MADKLHNFFSDNDFDIHEPHSGHLDRFQRKLQNSQKKSSYPWKWMSIAASIVLVVGFYLGTTIQPTNKKFSLAGISPNMAETETFFISTIKQELKEIEKHRNIETEMLIEHALDEIEELEEKFQAFSKELQNSDNKRIIIKSLINNYQQRLNILEQLLVKLEYQKNPAKFELKNDEII